MSAMRDVAVDSSGTSRRRAVIGTVLTAIGVALVVTGASGDGAMPPIGLGALAVFAGVIVLGPVVGARFVRIVGTPVAATRGMTGVLARDNASRNPKRTALSGFRLLNSVITRSMKRARSAFGTVTDTCRSTACGLSSSSPRTIAATALPNCRLKCVLKVSGGCSDCLTAAYF